MQTNPVKDRLAAGETVFGTMVFEFSSPGLPEILQRGGADFVFYDMEHSGFSYAEVKTQLALCRAHDIVPFVRPRATTRDHTAQLLDLGALGILFQMCETAEQAADFVSQTRYPPSGSRGAMFGGAHDGYGGNTVPEIIDASHERTLVCALIESEQGIANAEEIMSVPGVDVGHLGHGDLSLSLGVPGDTAHPTMQASIDALLAACEKHGKAAACLAGDATTGIEWANRGFRMISYNYDIGLMAGALQAGIAEIKKGMQP